MKWYKKCIHLKLTVTGRCCKNKRLSRSTSSNFSTVMHEKLPLRSICPTLTLCLSACRFILQDAHTQPFNSRWSGTTRVGRYKKKLTHSHPSWTSDILYQLPPYTMIHSIFCVQFTCLTVLWQPLSGSSSVFLLVLDPLLHTPCISSPSHYLLFAEYAHTNAACSAVIPMLCPMSMIRPSW